MTSYDGPPYGYQPPSEGYQPPQGYQPPPGFVLMPSHAAQAAPPAPDTGRLRLPVVSLIVAAAALVAVLVLAVVGFAAMFALAADVEDSSSGGGSIPVTGQLDQAPTGPLTGAVLVGELTATLKDGGSTVKDLRCPDTPSVRQGVVTVCHGTVDDESWALTVFFENTDGAYTVDFV